MRTAAMPCLAKAVFLDKDGTLVDNVPYNVDPARIVLARAAGAGLRLFKLLGFRLLVVSNQPGVALGYFGRAALDGVHAKLALLLQREGVRLDGFYYCPHRPGAGGAGGASFEAGAALACSCRKPRPGLLLRAAAEHGIDLGASWMVGDILDDVEAGRRAGCRSILIDNGNETEWQRSRWRTPQLVAPDLHAAALRVQALERTTTQLQDAVHAGGRS
jgi:D-glycero-D-manno-heptose 1,7-bisphosphate phosphatase